MFLSSTKLRGGTTGTLMFIITNVRTSNLTLIKELGLERR
jgi:hypothetical protein